MKPWYLLLFPAALLILVGCEFLAPTSTPALPPPTSPQAIAVPWETWKLTAPVNKFTSQQGNERLLSKEFCDGEYSVTAKEETIFASGVGDRGNWWELKGQVKGSQVEFTLGPGLTPGIGPALTAFTGTRKGNSIEGTFTGTAAGELGGKWDYVAWSGNFKVSIRAAPVPAQSTILALKFPIWFADENDFTHWSARIDGVNVTDRLPRSELGRPIRMPGRRLAAGDHLIALAFYYPDGWWVRLVWVMTVPPKPLGAAPGDGDKYASLLVQAGDGFINLDEFRIDAPRLLGNDPQLGQGPRPARLVGPEEPPVPPTEPITPTATPPAHMKCERVEDGHVDAIKGVVDVKRPDDPEWVEVLPEAGCRPGQVCPCSNLPKGTEVSVGYDSEITLSQCTGGTVVIKSNTQVTVEPLLFKKGVVETKLRVNTGTIKVDVKKGELKADLKVSAPNPESGAIQG